MHGMGLKMEDVSLEHQNISMQAGHMNFNVRLLPLLLGKIEVATLDVHDAQFRLGSGLPDQASLARLAALPVNRIRLIRARVEDSEGRQILQDARLDLRNIGPEHEALWEFQGQQDKQSLNGHGSLSFHHGKVDSGFGKLKFENIPVTLFSPLAPDSLRKWFGDPANRVGGALTLDLKSRQSWSMFGEARVNSENNGKILSLRGKLHHPDADQYFWDDSFVHIGDKAVITTKGQCFQLECETSIAAKQLTLQTWAALLPGSSEFLRRFEGNSDINASLKWQQGEWQATGNLLLRDGKQHLRQESIPLPELYFDEASIAGNLEKWQAAATLSVAEMYGKVAVKGSRLATGATTLQLETESIEKLPPPLLNTFLDLANIGPGLQAKGKLAGSMLLSRNTKGINSMQLQFNADQALVAHPAWIEKPAGVAARCRAFFNWPANGAFRPTALKLEQCQLDKSRIGELSWQRLEEKQSIKIDALDVDLNALRQSAVQLPKSIQNIAGRLTGRFSSTWPEADSSLLLHQADGRLLLENFGTAYWLASGELKAANGTFSSPQLNVTGAYGQADLQGQYSLASQQGNINILAGRLDWNKLPQLAGHWKNISLTGQVRQGHLQLLDNELQQIESGYRLEQGMLELKEFSSKLAGGLVQSPLLSLVPKADGLAIFGNIRSENIQLGKVNGLNQWLQAELDGKLHTNLRLQGKLPAQDMAGWQMSNGDILIYNGSWRQTGSASLPERLGIGKTAKKPARFSKLSFRFRMENGLVDISRLKMRQGQSSYSGVAGIKKSRHIHGLVKESSGKQIYSLDGIWPVLGWHNIQ